jgi:hypothetical protein
MWTKRNLLHYGSIVRVLCPWVVLILVGSVAFHGCIRIGPEELSEAVETAMRRSIVRHRAEILQKVTAGVDRLAVAEMERLNMAERKYGTVLNFVGRPGITPLRLGGVSKAKRNYFSYELIDVSETGSLIFLSYEVIVGYNYEVLRTEERYTGNPQAREQARRDYVFRKTDEKGSLKLLYRFDADLEWDGRDGRPGIMRTRAEPPAPSGLRPTPSLPVPKVRGDPPPGFIEQMQSSPLLRQPPRRKRNLDDRTGQSSQK